MRASALTETRIRNGTCGFWAPRSFANCLAFIGSNYFDQTRISWFLLLVIISTATTPILEASATKENAVGDVTVRTGLGYAGPAPLGALAKSRVDKSRERLKV